LRFLLDLVSAADAGCPRLVLGILKMVMFVALEVKVTLGLHCTL
jgi:hypothetical protein